MPEQRLNGSQMDACLQQVRCIGMPQRVLGSAAAAHEHEQQLGEKSQVTWAVANDKLYLRIVTPLICVTGNNV